MASLTTHITVMGSPGTAAFTTASFTPSNNSLLCVMVAGMEQIGDPLDLSAAFTISDSATLTWNSRKTSGPAPSWTYGIRAWTAPVTTGASMTVSIDAGAVEVRQLLVWVFDVTGYNTGTPVGGTAAGSDADGNGVGSITLDAAPAAGDIVAAAAIVQTGGTGSITHGTGWTEVYENGEADWLRAQFQRITGVTSTAVQWDDLSATGSPFDALMLAIVIKAASGGGVELAGSGQSGATGSGALTVAVAMAGTGLARAESQAALTVAVALSGSGRAQTEGLGSLNSGALLAGTGTARSTGLGALTVAAALSGAGIARVSGVGSFGADVLLAGTGSVPSHGLGALTVAAAPSGTGVAQASGLGVLAVPYRSPDLLGNASPWWIKTRFAAQEPGGAQLTGTGRVVASGIGVLAVRSVLAGAGIVRAGSSAALTVRAALSGTGSVLAAGLGALNSGAVLSGTGLAGSSGLGQLTLRVALSGTGSAGASGTGSLLLPGAVLAGTGRARSSAQADLLAQHAALQAIANARASSSAALTVMAALAGTGQVKVSGIGNLAVQNAILSESYRYDIPAASLLFEVQ